MPARISSHSPRITLRRRIAMAMSRMPVTMALAPIHSTSTSAVRSGCRMAMTPAARPTSPSSSASHQSSSLFRFLMPAMSAAAPPSSANAANSATTPNRTATAPRQANIHHEREIISMTAAPPVGTNTTPPRLLRQGLVADAVRSVGVLPEALPAVLEIVGVVALEPDGLRITFEGQDVRRHAVEEPAVVRDHHRAARKAEQRALERAQRLDVEVVGRLIEQQQVAAALQQLGEVHAVALAAGELADGLLLVGAAEVEARDVAARRRRIVSDLDVLQAIGDFFPHGFLRIERISRLIDVRELHRFPHLQPAGIRLDVPGQDPEQRRFPRAVRPDDADDAPGRQAEG